MRCFQLVFGFAYRRGVVRVPETLVKMVKLLALEVTEKNESSASTHIPLFKVDASLEEANQYLDPGRKRIEELEKSIKESQERKKGI